MDIRVQAYRPVTVQSFAGSGGRAVAVSDARQSAPVAPISAIGANSRSSLQEMAGQLRQLSNTMANNGYTDATRGSNINILA